MLLTIFVYTQIIKKIQFRSVVIPLKTVIFLATTILYKTKNQNYIHERLQ